MDNIQSSYNYLVFPKRMCHFCARPHIAHSFWLLAYSFDASGAVAPMQLHFCRVAVFLVTLTQGV